MQHTDIQLKQALTKMLPEQLEVETQYYELKFYGLAWKNKQAHPQVLDTELLHLCWLVEEPMFRLHSCYIEYENVLIDLCEHPLHASWQQRVIALAKVKGIEIV